MFANEFSTYLTQLFSQIVTITKITLFFRTLISGTDENFEFDSCLTANVSACSQTQGDKFTVVVYNPLSHKVTAPISLPTYDKTNWHILDPDDNTVDYQIENSLIDFSYVDDAQTSKTTIQFSAKDVPAMGFKVYRVEANALQHKVKKPPNPRVLVGYDVSIQNLKMSHFNLVFSRIPVLKLVRKQVYYKL